MKKEKKIKAWLLLCDTEPPYEVFKVVDFGNIQKFFLFSQTNLIKGLIEEAEGMKKSRHPLDCDFHITGSTKGCDCGLENGNNTLQKVIDYLKE